MMDQAFTDVGWMVFGGAAFALLLLLFEGDWY